MEQGRLLIAIALSIVVFVIWGYLDPNRPQDSTVPKEVPTMSEKSQARTVQSPSGGIQENPLPAYQKSKNIVVNTPLYTVVIADKGAVFKNFQLKKYRETISPDSPKKELIPKTLPYGTLNLSFLENSVSGLNEAVFLSTASSENVDISGGAQSISFMWTSSSGVVIEKQYTFNPDTYVIDMNVVVKNGSAGLLKDSLALSLSGVHSDANASFVFEGPSAYVNNKLEQIAVADLEKKNVYQGKIDWTCIEDRYFVSSILPAIPVNSFIKISYANGLLENSFVEPEINLPPGTQQNFQYKIYIGPKSFTILSDLAIGLEKVVYFGFFDFLAKPCLWLLNFLYGFIPNYGVAIILLTLIIKAVLWPLGNKSYKSMSEMKKIQPLMMQIREKYKNDKKKINEETMALYRTYKVNPLGGCLPMLVQIPVFFALYQMLYNAIELRHAPFLLWITDLSAPDRLFNIPYAIPFMEAPYGIPVLTIIMGATMFIQQKMAPPMGDPMQAKIMMFMPIVFTVIFINFSAGLVLYWLINNIVSIGQQYYVQKKSL